MEQTLSATALLSWLQSRQSVGQLTEPAPNQQQIEQAIATALTAPDHYRLQPWRFLLIDGERREAFGQLVADCMAKGGLQDETQLERLRQQPLRAPMLLVCMMNYHPHDKVPQFEQLLSCGAAVQNVLLALQAQGFSTMWRTGEIVESPHLKQALGCQPQDVIAGIVYIGTAAKMPPARQQTEIEPFMQCW